MSVATPADLLIATAASEDVGEIWALQRAAHVDEAQTYGDPYLAPLTETPQQIRALLADDLLLLKAMVGPRVVGTVRGRPAHSRYLISRLAVAPDQRRRGIGRALLSAIEERALEAYPHIEGYALSTGHCSDTSLRLCRSLGYTESGRQRVSDHLTLVNLSKPVAAPA
ncbi:GNAT family N-acetyltransferase [Salinactinospora qingdaonensis]|uniref:N-acetyltransferase domain-containing protein n=1 Tax=Salinactinospora qingdaonensis TaxID=702744 RepID=A0ABP7FQA2_9ACTN